MSAKLGNVSSGANNGASSVTFLHAIANQPNRVLYVAVGNEDGTAGDRLVSGITFNGVALTLVNSITSGSDRVEIWRLINPDVVTANIVVTQGGVCDSLGAIGIDYHNAMQQAPEADVTATIGTSTITTALSSISGEASILNFVLSRDVLGAFTFGAGEVSRADVALASARIALSDEIVGNAGSNSQSATQTSAARLLQIVVAVTGIHEVIVNDSVSVNENVSMVVNPLIVSKNDSITATENLSVNLSGLNLSVNDTIAIIENIIVARGIAFSVNETITITENVLAVLPYFSVFDTSPIVENSSVSLNVLNVSVNDSVAITEVITQPRPTPLNLSAFETFLITESISVVDLVVEVGVVAESISISESATAFIGTLVPNLNDLISVAESATLSIPMSFSVFDNASISENFSFGLTPLQINAFEIIAIMDVVSVSLDALYFSLLEPFSVTITEHTDVIDLVVEVGTVMEAINALDSANASLTVLFVSVQTNINVSENVNDRLDALYTNSVIIDNVMIVDLVMMNTDFIFVFPNSENITHQESAVVSLGELIVSVSDSFSVAENNVQSLEQLNIYLYDNIFVATFNYQYLGVLNVDYFESILVDEFANQGIETLKFAVNDSVSVSEDYQTALFILDAPVYDDLAVAENFNARMDIIYASGFDDITVNDIAQTVDGLKQVGIVRDLVNVLESVSLYPTTLNFVVQDLPGNLVGQHKVEEYIQVSLPIATDGAFEVVSVAENAQVSVRINLSVFDAVSVTENHSMVRDPEIRAGVDNIGVTQFASARPDSLHKSIFTTVSVAEATSVSLGELNVSVFESATVVEFLKMTDIVIELGTVFETVSVGGVGGENVIIVIFSQFLNINVRDNLLIIGNQGTLGLTPLFLNAFDVVSVVEAVFPNDEVIELDAVDNVSVSENKNVTSPFDTGDIIFYVFDSVTVSEQQSVLLPILRLSVYENFILMDAVSVEIGLLFFSVSSNITVTESFTPQREIHIVVSEIIMVTERFVIRDEYYDDAPRLFDFPVRVRIFESFQQSEEVLIP